MVVNQRLCHSTNTSAWSDGCCACLSCVARCNVSGCEGCFDDGWNDNKVFGRYPDKAASFCPPGVAAFSSVAISLGRWVVEIASQPAVLPSWLASLNKAQQALLHILPGLHLRKDAPLRVLGCLFRPNRLPAKLQSFLLTMTESGELSAIDPATSRELAPRSDRGIARLTRPHCIISSAVYRRPRLEPSPTPAAVQHSVPAEAGPPQWRQRPA